MPFTLVHPAAVVPIHRSPLVLPALVAGSVAPDLPYYVSLQWIGGDYNLTLTHTVSSLLWLDLLIGGVLLLVFEVLLKRPLVSLTPRAVAARLEPAMDGLEWRSPTAVVWIAASLVIGAGTHLAWDRLGELANGSSDRVDLAGDAVGVGVLAVFAWRWWRATAPGPVPPGRLLDPRLRIVVVCAAATMTVVWVVARAVVLVNRVSADLREYGGYSPSALAEYVVRGAAVDAATAVAVLLGAYAIGWHTHRLATRNRGRVG